MFYTTFIIRVIVLPSFTLAGNHPPVPATSCSWSGIPSASLPPRCAFSGKGGGPLLCIGNKIISVIPVTNHLSPLYFYSLLLFTITRRAVLDNTYPGAGTSSASLPPVAAFAYSTFCSTMVTNKMAHIVNGNTRTKFGVKIGFWNINRGLLDGKSRATDKFSEIHNFVTNNKIHIMGVCETGLHGPRSRVHRATPVTDLTLSTELNIIGYDILLPETWRRHDTARLAVYSSQELTVKRVGDYTSIRDLPVVSVEARLGRGAPTIISFFYREYTGGILGLKNLPAQHDRLTRLMSHWASLDSLNKDIIILGDMNLCHLKWNTQGDQQQILTDTVKQTQVSSTLLQIVHDITRTQLVKRR